MLNPFNIIAATLATLVVAFLAWQVPAAYRAAALLDCAGLETLDARDSCYRDVLLQR